MSNSIGKIFRVTSFGESHGKSIGVIIDGCPAGVELDMDYIQSELDRRRPGQSSITTSRNELDKFEILSGVFNGRTTGAPICMIIWNQDRDSSKYHQLKDTPRPGHADYTASLRYGGFNDYRGGGRFSGRITAGFVMAGAVSKQILEQKGITINAFTQQIGELKAPPVSKETITEAECSPVRCPHPETAEKMIQFINEVKRTGDSIGGVVECHAYVVPPGVGQPIFDTLEGDLSKAFFAIPAVKAVEFGAGVRHAEMRGSESNDPFMIHDGAVETSSNNSGGILGGISNGIPIVSRVTFKPTPSIQKAQKTVNLKTREETEIAIEGRHDPCIVPRAVPVVESVTAIVLVDHLMRCGMLSQVMEGKS